MIFPLAMLTLLFSQRVMQAVALSARVFVQSVLPSLFPMMVLGRLAPSGGSAAGLTAFAFLCGSPAAAQRVQGAVESGCLPSERLESLAAVTGVMSPMFFVGALAGWMGKTAAAWVMLGCHWLSALLVGGLWRLLAKPAAIKPARASLPRREGRPQAILSSCQAMLGICGAMMLFSAAMAVLEGALTTLFPAWAQANQRLLALVWALLEIGGGASAVTGLWPAPPMALLCGLCSFGGLSIWLQNLLFVGKYIRPAKLLAIRALHGAAAYGLCAAAFALLTPFLSF